MFDEDLVQTVLLALATGYPDRAASAIFERDGIPLADRQEIVSLIMRAESPADAASQLGDWLRVHSESRSFVNECYRVSFYASDDWRGAGGGPLLHYFWGNKAGRPLDKWPHYFPIYERYLGRFVGTAVKVLEIGVFRGGGLDMLSYFLGPDAELIGLDIDETARDLADPKFPVVIADQTDAAALRTVNEQYGPFDVIIDDGGHTVNQQVISAETLFPLLKDGGVYLVEDVHTSYWPEYQDWESGNFLDWVRGRMDDLHAFHRSGAEVDEWGRWLDACHVYDSVVVLEKKRRVPPFSEVAGAKDFALLQRDRQSLHVELLATRDAALRQRDEARRQRDEAAEEHRISRSWRAGRRLRSLWRAGE